jgi:hypothetical protein
LTCLDSVFEGYPDQVDYRCSLSRFAIDHSVSASFQRHQAELREGSIARKMNNCGDCIAIILVATTVAGCGTTAIQGRGVPRLLTGIEMDEVSAGSATAKANTRAVALGIVPQTTAATNTLASTGIPRSAPPFLNLLTLNYASSQAVATASNAWLTVADGSTNVAVDGGGGGAKIDAATTARAAGSGTSQAQIYLQFYGLSLGRVDLVFGTVIAAACCSPSLRAQTTADGTGGGYWSQLKAYPISVVSGQVQSTVDISVVSSALPILGAGQVSALIAPTLAQSIGQ